MVIWKNTNSLDNFDDGLIFTDSKQKAEVLLIGSKPINIIDFPNIKGIFKVGIGKDNVPEKEAEKKEIIVRYPSKETSNIIYEETASFTCGLILRMLYSEIGKIDPWTKSTRTKLSEKNLLIIGTGNIGSRVALLMEKFTTVTTFEILKNQITELELYIRNADCISIHIPKVDNNIDFFDLEKLSWMKNDAILINTARGAIVNENALYKELSKNRIKAAFDVFWNEPYNGKLLEFYPDPFFMTPHVASTCIGFLEGCKKDLNSLIKDISKI